jgi:hypothetical protein
MRPHNRSTNPNTHNTMKINASNKVAKFACSLLTVIILLVASGRFATAANLITNGDFETQDFTGWTVIPAADGLGDIVIAASIDRHFASFEAKGADLDAISQTFATTPGAFYDLSFFYEVNLSGQPPNNEFIVLFNGVSVFSQLNGITVANVFTFTNLQATGTMTTLEFEGRNATGFDLLTNVSVTASSAPDTGSTLGLLFLSLIALLGVSRLRSLRLA